MKKLPLAIALLLFLSANAQNSDWILYNEGNSDLPDDLIRSIVFDGNGHKWIATNGGLAEFDDVNWNIYTTDNSPLVTNQITSVAVESDSIKWIGCYFQGGLARYDGQNWSVYNESNSGLPNNWITSIAIDSSGHKWIGTNGGGLAEFDDSNWTIYNTSNSDLPSNSVEVVEIDDNGILWIGTSSGTNDSGLSKFDGQNWTLYNTDNSGLAGNDVTAIALDSNQHVWTGSYYQDMSYFDGQDWILHDTVREGGSGYATTIAIDNEGSKWIGTYGFGNTIGFAKFDGTNWFVLNENNSELPVNNVLTIAIDENGSKWIGMYYGGLAVYSGSGLVTSLSSSAEHTDKNLILYPIPANDQLNIKTTNNETIKEISLYNSIGELVLLKVTNGKFASLDLSKLGNGVFYVKVNCVESAYVKKIILK
ncbi:T9SS type A sorting domain-containing protein [Cryomorphaceae bacterium 1068]|nr:T9SS type A sorting domain-containing protein [Cryomorphaceae bacterium 1068]